MANLNFRILPHRKRAGNKIGIYLAVSHLRETRYISTEFEIDNVSQFENGRVCHCKDADIVAKRMDHLMSEYKERLSKLNPEDFKTCAELKEALMKKPRKAALITLDELMKDRISRLKEEGRDNYAKMHEDSRKVYYKILGDTPLCDLSRSHIRRLSLEMQKQGLSNGSRQMRLAHLKASINEAITERIVKYEDHPFTGFTMPSAGRKQTDLTIDDFLRLRDAELVSTRARFARDMFLLSFYLGGINMVDLLEVDLSRDELRYSRKKTRNKKNGDTETVFTIPKATGEIIRKHAPNGKLIWPGKRERYDIMISYLNNCFGALRKETEITPLSYYSARHTFAQFAFEVGTPLEVVEYLLGQSMKTNRPIFNYCRVMKKQADTAMRKIIDFTEHPENYEL